ncbi:4-hydroxyacetophenone monooxygenase [Ceratobasidium theobromae]|uniref:4-hydroxyacetophenone monooxygenase n=1 Tax=Ceratobasidium theobromae TaxID=1582974 RepID=A0A5N5QG94_9AGAM|nr:4-hydroxyacetophenone monooxygenase [Ceratobasidium theobromae]
MNNVTVAIIGAGVGGIATAISLQQKLGEYDYEIYDMAEGLGGTWKILTQAVRVMSPATGIRKLSSDLNPNWSQMFVGYAEIRQYWEKLAAKHMIGPHFRFRSEVVSAVWSEAEQQYTLTIRDVRTKETRQVRARMVLTAVGVFHKPKWPEIQGHELFKGVSMHARAWNHKVDFSGKKVAVIGNGCSGTQMVPVISDDHTTNVIQFCRTPNWYLPRPQATISESAKWVFRNVPGTARLFRWAIAAQLEMGFMSFKLGPFSSMLRRQKEQTSINYIKKMTPEKYHKDLIPNYPIGCKRIIFDPDYLQSLQRSNVDLEWDSIERITENGILTKTGKFYDVDIICYATGFDVERSFTIDVTGRDGQTLANYYKEQGAPTAYMGTTTPGFPNWFTIFGPNTTTGHASVIYSIEIQIGYALQLIKPLLRGKAKSLVPRAEATRVYNEFIQDELSRTVWTSCVSWYRTGDSRQGKIMTWPGTLGYMWWLLRKPIWKDYESVGGEGWLRRRRFLTAARSAVEILLMGAGVGTFVLMKLGKWEQARRLVIENARRLIAQ